MFFYDRHSPLTPNKKLQNPIYCCFKVTHRHANGVAPNISAFFALTPKLHVPPPRASIPQPPCSSSPLRLIKFCLQDVNAVLGPRHHLQHRQRRGAQFGRGEFMPVLRFNCGLRSVGANFFIGEIERVSVTTLEGTFDM